MFNSSGIEDAFKSFTPPPLRNNKTAIPNRSADSTSEIYSQPKELWNGPPDKSPPKSH